jgi:hypothetical protein
MPITPSRHAALAYGAVKIVGYSYFAKPNNTHAEMGRVQS